ncbi:MAG TPA: hypothetical protein ENH01_00785 [Nitrospirae bacterium]|nr:hypothetical protein [Nitrospirota bacterium]
MNLNLPGTERYAHVGAHAFDPARGPFAGLNVLPESRVHDSVITLREYEGKIRCEVTETMRDSCFL